MEHSLNPTAPTQTKNRIAPFLYDATTASRRVVVFVHNFRDIQADDFIPPRYFCGYDAEYALACTYRVSPKKDLKSLSCLLMRKYVKI